MPVSKAYQVRKATTGNLAARDEGGLRDSVAFREREAAIKHRLKQKRSATGKKTPLDNRGSDREDFEIFKGIQSSLDDGRAVRFASRRGASVIQYGYAARQAKAGRPVELPIDLDELIDVWVPAWKHTGDHLKSLAWIMALQTLDGVALTFNLNLGSDVIAMAHEAQKARGIGFARFVRDRITKKLRAVARSFGIEVPDFFFWVEADRADRAHLHGVIVMPWGQDMMKVHRKIRRALKAAGGRWRPTDSGRQLFTQRIRYPAGWVGYVTKWANLTRLRIADGNTVAATSKLRRAAKDWYSHAREGSVVLKK